MMKQLRYFCTLLLCAVASMAWADTVILKYSGSTTANLAENDNVAATLGLNAEEWSVIADKGSASNNVGVNKSGDFRLYWNANGSNTLTVSSLTEATINSIKITFTGDSYSNVSVTVGGTAVTAVGGEYEINSTSFVLGNANTSNGQVRISQVEITYTKQEGAKSNPTVTIDKTTLEIGETATVATNGPAVTLVSEDDDIATVSGSTITAVGAGEVSVTATWEENDEYNAGEKEFTITVKAPVEPSDDIWKAVALGELTADDVFIIVGSVGTNNYALSNDKGGDSAPTAVGVTVQDGYVTGSVEDKVLWTVSGDATNGYTFYPNGSSDTWLYCTNTNNGVRVGTNDNKAFVIKDNYLYNNGTSRYIGIYNSQDWRCYTTINNNIKDQTFAFYKKTTANAPSIAAENVTIGYDVTESSISYQVANPVDGGVLTATTTADWVTLGTVDDGAIPFTATENADATERTASVLLTYTYGTESVNKEVIITQEANPSVILSNIAALTALTDAGDYQVKLTDALVTYVSGTNAYLEDASGAVLLFKSAGDLKAGDKITGTANVTYTIYNKLPEVTAFTLEEGYTLTSGNEVTPTVVTLAQMNEDYNSYISRYVKIEEATVTSAFANKNSTIEQDGVSIVLRDQNSTATLTTTVDDVVTVTAHPSIYNATKQIAVYEQSQIVVKEDVIKEASITVETTTIDVDAAEHSGTIKVTYKNISDIAAEVKFYESDGTTAATYDWVATEIDADNNISYLIEGNTGEERTAYLKVYGLDDEANDVYSDLITITQAAYVAPQKVELPFYESFNTNEGSGGNDDSWSGSIASKDIQFDNEGWTSENANGADKCVKAGTGKAGGNLTTPTLPFEAGKTYKLTFKAAAWDGKSEKTTLSLSATSATVSQATVETVKGAWTEYTVYLTSATGEGTVTFSTSAGNNRFFLDEVKIEEHEVEAVTVTISSKATDGTLYYGTLYYSDRALVVPADAEACTYAVIDGELIDSKTYKEAEVVPAGEAVVIYAVEPGTYTFEVGTTTAEKDADNMLKGTDEAATISDAGYKYYMLSLNAKGEEGSVGFYWGKDSNEGTQIANGAHKAYLAVPEDVAAGVRGFTFGGDATGIEAIDNSQFAIDNGIYNLAGQRVAKAQKGVYIVGGKKVVIR